MKNTFLVIILLFSTCIFGQAYTGKGDVKFQVGANLQNNGTGISGSLDFGVGENISFGVSSSYLLGVDEVLETEFIDRFDIKGRFNANIGNVINVDENLDIYPGLYLSMKNFGGHFGVRYFFTSGFGVFSELTVPFAKYNTTLLTPAETLHNQFSVNLGASFNI
ncbi:DUF6646 family protein [Ulvibacter antarcticus]|uniref:Outer membrane protein with beta-barrel domain n=1 Tax=Ulvibacter antarcticus TaxID=442714 RepID=A0A3L9Z168_9FLAO|nr:DUF6646 family protein [Ulvibacter antarcticus]RMA65767.1 hypothetical protein BXY75_0180 [Ulvibacter antarcticus]